MYRGQGKDYIEQAKLLKKLCIKMYGIGFILATPKIKAIIYETTREFINEMAENITNLGKEKESGQNE